jgi:tripartite motif-containing protein 71
LLAFTLLSFYSLIAILSFSSSITLLPSYSQQQQEEYILIREWGSKGFSPGQFSQPADVAIDSKDNVFVSDFGANNYIVKFDSNGKLITEWGTAGNGNGQFISPLSIANDLLDNVYVVDYGNDRIQKFQNNGEFIATWGTSGNNAGQFQDPEGVATDSKGNIIS